MMEWKCMNCGKCCISLTEQKKFILPLRKEDIPRLKQVDEFNELVSKGSLVIAKGTYDYDTKTFPKQLEANGLCPFFNKTEGLCRIYQYRPSICRNFDCDTSNL